MSAPARTTLECNATVDLTTTEFVASGRPERVVEFLRRVCEALADLPLDRLAVEADVLRTEDSVVAAPAVGALLAERYGARGVGLAGFRDPALRALSAQDVREWAAPWFARRVTLLHAAPGAAFEALWPSKADAWVAQADRWTVVVREGDEQEAYAAAAGTSAVTGRSSAVLLLEQAYDELSIVLLQRGKERDRHLWTGEPHDPSVLAAALAVDPAALAPVLAGGGPPDRVLAELTRVLDLPPQVAPLLAGADPADVEGMTHERARGVRESIAAAARGDYDPPASRRLSHRISRWERERPAPYRLANGAAAAVQAALAGVAASGADGDWTSWPGALTALLGLGAAGSLWSTRPPRKR